MAFDTPQINTDLLSSVDLYCQAFRRWQIECSLTVHTLNHYKWLAYNAFLQQISSNSRASSLNFTATNTNSSRPAQTVPDATNGQRNRQQRALIEAPLGVIGRRYRIAPFWRRLAAEFIDFLLMLLLSNLLFLFLFGQLPIFEEVSELLNLFRTVLDLEAGAEGAARVARVGAGTGALLPHAFGGGHAREEVRAPAAAQLFSNSLLLIPVSPTLLLAELISTILVTVYEALFLAGSVGNRVGGCTIGKRLLGLRVIACSDVFTMPNGWLEIIPATHLGFLRSFVRSSLKNFTMHFLFPMGLTALFLQHRRATYDLLAGSIVVMEPSAPAAGRHSRRPSQPNIAPAAAAAPSAAAAAAPPAPAAGASGAAPVASPNSQPAADESESDFDPDDELD